MLFCFGASRVVRWLFCGGTQAGPSFDPFSGPKCLKINGGEPPQCTNTAQRGSRKSPQTRVGATRQQTSVNRLRNIAWAFHVVQGRPGRKHCPLLLGPLGAWTAPISPKPGRSRAFGGGKQGTACPKSPNMPLVASKGAGRLRGGGTRFWAAPTAPCSLSNSPVYRSTSWVLLGAVGNRRPGRCGSDGGGTLQCTVRTIPTAVALLVA